ncbi:MAG: hypothetical protein JNM93_00875 [Bacteriovoracaceae bacterium]|nr:hypothetical protein [Bacteriovoracaceae bacterium]
MMILIILFSTYLNAQVYKEPKDALEQYRKVYQAEQQKQFGDIEYIIISDITPTTTHTQRIENKCEKTVRYTYQIAEDLWFYQFYKQPKSYGEVVIECVSVFETGGKACSTVVDEYTYAPTVCAFVTDTIHSDGTEVNQNSRGTLKSQEIEEHNKQIKRSKSQ